MPAPWTKTAAGSAGSKGRPPVAAKTRLPSTRSSTDLLRRAREAALRLAQGLREVIEDVAQLLDADGKADHVLADPSGGQLLRAHLPMRGTGRMDHQRLGVTYIGEVRDELQPIDEALAGGAPASDAEAHHRARAVWQQAPRERVIRMARQIGVQHPGDGPVLAEEVEDAPRVLHVARHAQRQ